MTDKEKRKQDKLGQTLDHRRVNKGAQQQPWTVVSYANKGPNRQPWTGNGKANKGKTKDILNICTYNCRTLYKEHLDNLLLELDEPKVNQNNEPLCTIKWDIIGLCETKLLQNFNTLVKGGHILFNSGHSEGPRRNGVGFLIHRKHKERILEFKGYSERLAVLKLKGKYKNITLIQAYAPTTSHDIIEVEEFYKNLQNIINTNNKKNELLILGDFNAKIGNLHLTYPNVIGPHSLSTGHNERGKMLLDFCCQNQMFITNTNFKHRRKYTWISPDGQTRNQIDFILIKKSSLKKVQDSGTISTPDISDHKMVRCKIKFSFPYNRRKESRPQSISKQLTHETIQQKYQLEIIKQVEQLENTSSNQTKLSQIKNVLITSAQKVEEPSSNTARNNWISRETIQTIHKKHAIRKSKGSKSIEYKLVKSLVKKMCRIDKEKFIDKEHREISNMKDSNGFYESIKRLKISETSKVKNWEIKNKNNITLTNKEEILEEWASFYEELYHSDTNHFTPLEEKQEDEIPPILPSELTNTINKLKNKKAPGPDSITAEMLKASGSTMNHLLLDFFNNIINGNEIPAELTTAEIVTLHKKGDKRLPSNYRPISLLSHIYKLLSTIIYNRIAPTIRESLNDTQAAYQPSRGTIEQIQSVQQIIEKTLEYQNTAVMCFVDFTKAFDSIKQEKLWQTLRELTNLNSRYINIIARLYQNSTATIRTDIGNSRCIKLNKGVKQGDVLSALLFCIIILAILINTLETTDNGIRIGGKNIHDLDYADDLDLMTSNPESMNELLEKFADTAEQYGLKINKKKTEVMLIGNINNTNAIHIKNEPLKEVNEFTYLGRKFSNDGVDLIAIEHRINNAWIAFNKKKSIITNKHISMEAKKKTYETYILPTLLYATETMTWSNLMFRKVNVFENHIMRWMTNTKLQDKVTIKELRQRTKIPPITNVIKIRKLRWFGHLKRSSTPAKQIFEGMVEGKRKIGRPRRRWRDDIHEWTQLNWQEINQIVQNRKEWKNIIHKCLK